MKNLENSKSYYRRYQAIDYIMTIIIAFLVFTGFGIIIAVPLAIFYPRMISSFPVSDMNDRKTKLMVSKSQWDKYRASHSMNVFNEWRPTKRLFYSNDNCDSSIGTADQIMNYKKLLDDGAITQEEFDAKKKQILGL